jgi:hypothetical protein
VRILETLAHTGLQPEARCEALNDAYLDCAAPRTSWRCSSRRPPAAFCDQRRRVLQRLGSLFGTPSPLRLLDADDPRSASRDSAAVPRKRTTKADDGEKHGRETERAGQQEQ